MRAIGVTGAPLSVDGFRWIRDALPGVWPFSTSGGTDVCTAFVGGVPTLPVYEGELQAPSLGCKVESWDEEGRHAKGRVGELVITEPMPSMPIGFWGDEDGARLRRAYFSPWPHVWRHGDWIELTERDTAIIYGRSDATINRGGVRMGTSEIYRAVLLDPDVVDALVVDLPRGDEPSWMPLFLVLRPGVSWSGAIADRVRALVRSEASPRHVPDQIVPAPEIPRTLSGKSLEVPVKRILMGEPADRVASRGSLANPEALDWFERFARDGLQG
jgi:acetoacetyl-CoA synthetase